MLAVGPPHASNPDENVSVRSIHQYSICCLYIALSANTSIYCAQKGAFNSWKPFYVFLLMLSEGFTRRMFISVFCTPAAFVRITKFIVVICPRWISRQPIFPQNHRSSHFSCLNLCSCLSSSTIICYSLGRCPRSLVKRHSLVNGGEVSWRDLTYIHSSPER